MTLSLPLQLPTIRKSTFELHKSRNVPIQTPVPLARTALEATLVAVVHGVPATMFRVEPSADPVALRLCRVLLDRAAHGVPAEQTLAELGFSIDADLADWVDEQAGLDRLAIERGTVRFT